MTNQEFISLLKSSRNSDSKYISDLKELLEFYPYFTLAHLLYLKTQQQEKDINFEKQLERTVLYIKDRRWLYNYLFTVSDKKITSRKQAKKSGDYFEMITAVEEGGGDVKQSLSELAERLKKARIQTVAVVNSDISEDNPVKDIRKREKAQEPSGSTNQRESDYTEKIRALMQQRKYEEALEILKELNLNNPKKSIYFADQIRFLEKIIENLKK